MRATGKFQSTTRHRMRSKQKLSDCKRFESIIDLIHVLVTRLFGFLIINKNATTYEQLS